MKKYFLFALVLFSLISCEENVKFNNPAFQAMKDNVFWRAVQSTATIAPGGILTIDAYTVNEKVTLKTGSAISQTYPLGTGTSNTATYVLTDAKVSITFSTGNGIGNGEIVITEYDAVNNTVSGTFKFNLENIFDNPLVGPTLNFQQGVFYKVPVIPASL